ncbi:MAG: hypothetical protein CMP48_24165 [Rickettsiales bacterium]|nr:hypothetical protein [Rickettsiales bacterium]
MQAIILAGGKGTRLKQLTSEIPKPMIPIGGKPIIEHQINCLVENGIEKIIITVNHLKKPLIDFIEDRNWGIEIDFFEEEKPLGTAGAFPLMEKFLEEQFLVIYGDVMLDMDFVRFIKFHNDNSADASLVIHPNDHPYDSDLVETNDKNRIVAFHSKPHQDDIYYKNMVNAGVYLFQKRVIDHLPGPVKSDFGKDIFPNWTDELKLYGYNTSEYLKDMGTPDRLSKVTEDFLSGKLKRRNLANPQKAIFLDRDGVLNEERHLIHKVEDLVLYPFTSEAIKKINNSDYLSVVVTNQSVVARNLCTIEELEYIHKKLDSNLGIEGAKLDALYYCPYHPDKGYPGENVEFKKPHPWRKPSPGMLLQAQTDFNIDLDQSFIIGDRETDILAGQNAGVTTIAVRTGHGFSQSSSEPDYIFEDVNEAVDFILLDPLKRICDQISTRLHLSSNKPAIILIGGNARSGKSTLAKRISKHLQKEQTENIIISLDNFLIEKSQRDRATNVFERFNFDETQKRLTSFLQGETIEFDHYHKDYQIDRSKGKYHLNNEQVIIIEGIPAFKLEFPSDLQTIKVFSTTSIDEYKKRFYHLYEWKGYEKTAIEELFRKRIKDEFHLIEPMKDQADMTIEI